MEIKEIEYENYGKCVKITNGTLDAIITIDCGPRIIHFGFSNCENLFYNDLERKYSHRIKTVSASEKNKMFHPYGGHRLWLTPAKTPFTFFPDNSPVTYTILPDGVSFLPPNQKPNDIQYGFEVMMGEEASDIMVVHTAKNCSKEPQAMGLWPISMLKAGGVVIIPQSTDKNDALIPNRSITFWPDTDIHDPRLFYGNRFITLTHSSQTDKPFKIGTNNISGWAVYVEENYTLMKRYVHNPQAAYPDFGCSTEVRLQPDFAALETLSPLYRVEPGDCIRHVENFSVFKTVNSINPTDEDSISSYIEKLK